MDMDPQGNINVQLPPEFKDYMERINKKLSELECYLALNREKHWQNT
jgi:hypothetical protein